MMRDDRDDGRQQGMPRCNELQHIKTSLLATLIPLANIFFSIFFQCVGIAFLCYFGSYIRFSFFFLILPYSLNAFRIN